MSYKRKGSQAGGYARKLVSKLKPKSKKSKGKKKDIPAWAKLAEARKKDN